MLGARASQALMTTIIGLLWQRKVTKTMRTHAGARVGGKVSVRDGPALPSPPTLPLFSH